MSERSSYADKRVAVLGATGFLGAHLVRRLVPLAKTVTAFARGSASPALPALSGARIVLGDIRSATDVAKAAVGADVVFMLAGRSGAVASVQESREDLDVNCAGMLTVLESVRSSGRAVRIVFPGSRLEYGKPLRLPVCEDDPLLPLVPYGIHKVFCEQYLEYYARRHGISFAVARFTNPYGPTSSAFFRGYNVLNDMIARAIAGETITIFGDGSQRRDYIFISDVVDLLLLLGEGHENVTVNGGSGVGTRIVDAAELICRLTGSGSIEHAPWPEASLRVETGDFVADMGRARSLGFRSHTPLEEGLRQTIVQQRSLGE